MLREKKMIDLEIIDNSASDSQIPCGSFIEADINGVRVSYDAMDGYNGYNHFDDYLDSVSVYFKRSYSEVENKRFRNQSKIRPLGLFYRVHYPNLPIFPKKGMKDRIMDAIRRLSGRDYRFYPDFFESKPNYNVTDIPNIFFGTRLWNPDGESDEVIASDQIRQERMGINNTRISLVRRLKDKYGCHFYGGINRTPYSETVCPELIIDENLYRRDNYIRALKKKFDICIGSSGLHQSIGGKIGEYVAASKCIVAEEFSYTATPEFCEGENYISFSTVEECLEKISLLVGNPDQIRKIEENNYNYYTQYLSPDMLIYNTIKQVLDLK